MYKFKTMLDENAIMPNRAHMEDAGMDLFCPNDGQPRYVMPHSSVVIDTGVHIKIPTGFVGMIKSKSGLNVKKDLTSEGVVDAGYTGSIVVKLYNHGDTCRKIEPGDKITQLVIISCMLGECELVDSLDDNRARGNNGFGSSGK